MSLRFNLDNEADRRAWEHLQGLSGSKNKAVISSINRYFETEGDLVAFCGTQRPLVRWSSGRCAV